MPFIYHQTPVGIARLTEEEGFVASISILDGEPDILKTAATHLLKTAARQLDEYFAGTRQVFDFPIKQHGSPFQQEVWQCLQQIEYGKTISYTQQSKLMKNPLAIRAIAAANGKNHLWVVVPCHRVIGADGGLIGYAGGLWRKRWLLEHEARIMGVGQTKLF